MKKNKLQIRTAEIRTNSVDEENRTAVFVISTEDVDSYNTVFRSSGWDFENYRRNPIVSYNHTALSSNPDNIIGITEEIWQEDTRTLARVRFEDEETNPLAEKIFKKVSKGTLRMASVNAYVDEATYGRSDEGEDPEVLYFTKQRLFEWSIVSLGSNPEAYKRNAEDLNQLKTEVEPKKKKKNKKRVSKLDISEARYMFNLNNQNK